MVSAFWHGFYPIYYVVFLMFTLLCEVLRDGQKMMPFIDKIIPNKFWQNVVGQIVAKYYVSFFLATHFALEFEKVFVLAHSFYFIPYITLLVIFGVFKLTGLPSIIAKKYPSLKDKK